MNTKYIKVPVSERLPKVSKEYYTNIGFLKFDLFTKVFYKTGHHNPTVEYWLEEVPDREEEIIEELKYLIKVIKSQPSFIDVNQFTERSEQLLNNLKQTT